MKIAVVGAHLSGLPLNSQLTERGATLLGPAMTSARYRFFALPKTVPPKPGLLRVNEQLTHGIALEIWELEPAAYASFVELVPPPLCIGNLELESGEMVKGFLVEPYALDGATDITQFGGWRAYLASLKK
ncbi:MAG: allophanate hydrolase-related protein [Tepidisphaeraceae bacterium]